MLIDIHTHVDDGLYNEDNYRVINAVEPDDFDNILSLSKKDKKIIPALGIHPWYANNFNQEILEKYIIENPSAYIGETGLDYGKRAVLGQEDVFINHLHLANKYQRPLMIHCYNASYQLYEILKDNISVPFLIHRYSDDIKMIEKFLDLGAYFSYSFNSPADKIKATPLNRILSETDGKMYTVLKSITHIAEQLKIEIETLKDNIWKNAQALLIKTNFNE